MKKIKTLLVDDHKIVRDGIRYILNSDKNIEVVGEASNGIEAIKYLEKNNAIDVVLMDINMPQLNGIDATEIIKKLYAKINVLALTMHNEESYIIDMIKSGAIGYVLKDTNSSILLDAVKVVATGKNYYSNDVTSTMVNQLFQSTNSKQNEIDLSDREIGIIKHIANGKTNKETAEIIGLSYRTIETHRRNILKKLGLNNTAELINYAYKKRIII
ncbi:MAG: response regulator transcription factor [Flavobacteriales bacterium]|nr:response regulator transcription factor [Flavobacteriales bacterium]